MAGVETDHEMQARICALRAGLQALGWVEGYGIAYCHVHPSLEVVGRVWLVTINHPKERQFAACVILTGKLSK